MRLLTIRTAARRAETVRVWAVMAACLVVVLEPTSAHAAIPYTYDALGRLTGLSDSAANRQVRYTYDSAGNLTGILANAPVSIASFTPTCAVAGTAVTIYGGGFATTPPYNTVKFNSVTATVMYSTATFLVVTVPAGNTAGPITVTNASGTATSPTPFGGSCAPPTITSLSPTVGVAPDPATATPGTTVLITGANFIPTPTADVVRFGVAQANVSAASATSLTATVPEGATWGPITVTTPYGTATSAQTFVVVPAPYGVAALDTQTQIAPGQAATMTISTAGHVGLLLFSGTEGQHISALAAPTTPWRLTLLGPYGPISVPNPPCGNTLAFIRQTVLPATGSYALLVDDPLGHATGSVTANLYTVTDNALSITPNGGPVTATTSVPGQMTSLTFTATAAQRVSLQVTPGTLTCCYNLVSIIGPDGGDLHDAVKVDAGGFLDAKNAPTSGTYTILLDPSSNLGTATFRLIGVPADTGSTLAIGGSAAPVSLTTPGQNGNLVFPGTAGQVVEIQRSSDTFTTPGADIFLMAPDGSPVAPPTSGSLGPVTLPQSGSYTIFVDPLGASTGSVSVTLTDCAGGGC